MAMDSPLCLHLLEYAVDMHRSQSNSVAYILLGERKDDRFGGFIIAVLHLQAYPVEEFQQKKSDALPGVFTPGADQVMLAQVHVMHFHLC